MGNEADTCRKYVLPKLIEAGWDNDPHSFTEQRTFTDGRIVVSGERIYRRPQKRADYLLRYSRDFPIAVIETKAEYKSSGAGLQQAKEYAEILGLNFNLDRKNPHAKEDISHLPPEQIVESILEKERRIVEILGEIKTLLGKSS